MFYECSAVHLPFNALQVIQVRGAAKTRITCFSVVGNLFNLCVHICKFMTYSMPCISLFLHAHIIIKMNFSPWQYFVFVL